MNQRQNRGNAAKPWFERTDQTDEQRRTLYVKMDRRPERRSQRQATTSATNVNPAQPRSNRSKSQRLSTLALLIAQLAVEIAND